MNDRIKRLREFSLNTKARFSTERAELITDFYGRIRGVSAPVRRALAFKYLMENKTICINDGELIVGERGPVPKAVPTYPELCCHSLQDLDVLSGRAKVPFIVSAEDREIYQKKIIPFWQRPIHARHDLSRDVKRMEGCVRSGRLHGIHGTTGPGSYGAGRQDLSSGIRGHQS